MHSVCWTDRQLNDAVIRLCFPLLNMSRNIELRKGRKRSQMGTQRGERMIKLIIYVNIAFFYRKANILHRWSNILRQLYWNKGVCHSCRSQ